LLKAPSKSQALARWLSKAELNRLAKAELAPQELALFVAEKDLQIQLTHSRTSLVTSIISVTFLEPSASRLQKTAKSKAEAIVGLKNASVMFSPANSGSVRSFLIAALALEA
jgi:hypothetical protein